MGISGNQKALMYALGGLARGGATRGGYTSMLPFISIGGTPYPGGAGGGRVLIADLTIRDLLDETPNTCQMTVMGTNPQPGSELIITLGSVNADTRLFGGKVLSTVQGYLAAKPSNVYHQLNGIDYTWLLGEHLVEVQYTNQWCSNIAMDLIGRYTTGITTNHIAPEIANIWIDAISFTNTALADALTQLASRAGAYWNIDYYKDLHFFTADVDPLHPDPTPLTPTHPSLANLTTQRDLSQVVTRVFVEGGGVTAATTVAPQESIIPLTDTAAWYQATGGTVVSGPQRITYQQTDPGFAGGFVGPGIGPTAAATLALQVGAGLGIGNYQYAYTYVTAAGESLPSPVATIATVASTVLANPTTPPQNIHQTDSPPNYTGSYPDYNATGFGPRIGESVEYAWSYSANPSGGDLSTETALSPPSPAIVVRQAIGASGTCPCLINGYVTYTPQPPGTTQLSQWHVWHRINGGAWVGPISNGNWANGNAFQSYADPAGFHPVPTPNAVIPAQCRVNLAAIGVAAAPAGGGTSPVTARRLYRTTVNGSQLKLVTTLTDNTTTTFLDTVADASLGANLPTGDTSGLQQPAGQVVAGSIKMPVTGAFRVQGGWAVIGNGEQVIRYTTFANGILGGIPPTGNGSITAAVAYNSTVTSPPMLLGVAGILYEIKGGDDVNLLVTVDDSNAQAGLAGLIGGSGIKEAYIQDRRIGYPEALARGKSALAARSQLLVEVNYTCRDIRTRSGATIVCNLPAPTNLGGSYKIQDVTISNFSATPGHPPTYTVMASSQRYSLDDLLRIARGTVGA